MREELIKTIKKTAKVKTERSSIGIWCGYLENPDEVADAILELMFGVEMGKIRDDSKGLSRGKT